jgi:diguanylate cyclase (GGDEF)-like protein/PAS domain S-box-containing protein
MVVPTPHSSVPLNAETTGAEPDLRQLLAFAPVAMAVLDDAGILSYGNAALATLLGRSSDAPQPTRLGDMIHGPEEADVLRHIRRLARGEAAAYRGEHRLVHADGSPRWVMLAAAPVPFAPRDEARVILQMTCIELQKQAEAALVHSESRWNHALESARQGVWDRDLRTGEMFYSRMWRTMRGIPADEHVDSALDNWLSRVHPDDRQRVLADVERQEQGVPGADVLEYRERTRNGDYIWILSRGGPVEWDGEGNALRTIGTDTDITRLKTMEAELASEKERLRVTLAAMADGMISTDLDGRIAFVNPAAEALIGVPVGEAEGQLACDVFRLVSERTGTALECPIWSCLRQGTMVRADDDSILVCNDGRRRDIRCTASPVLGPDGMIHGAVLVFQDVSQSRALQRQLAYSAAHDELTGLPNRAAFDRAFSAAVATARDQGRRHSLIYLDLDRFKPVNDTAGHAAGDALLKQVAQTIRGVCRDHDFVARVGGDEFSVLIEDSTVADGRLTAERIVRAISALVFSWGGREYRIGASAGIAAITSSPPSSLGVMGEADAACYAAKAAGRGRVVAFPEIGQPPQP